MAKLTSLIEGQIKQIAPNAKDVTVKIKKDHDVYLSKIHVQLPGIVIHAQKKGQTVWESINLAYDAVIKQVVKFKMKRKAKKKHRIWRWQDPLGPAL